MKFSIPKDENLPYALRKIADYIESETSEYVFVKNASLYANIQNKEGETYPNNPRFYTIKDGNIFDLDEEKIKEVKRIAVIAVSEKVRQMENAGINLDREIARAETYLNKAIRQNASTVDSWRKSLKELNEKKERAIKTRRFGAIIHEALKKSEPELQVMIRDGDKFKKTQRSILVRPIIDKKCHILSQPLYFYKDGFSYSDLPYNDWFSREIVY